MKQYKKLQILRKVEYTSDKDVCDICVDDNHTYLSENGVINHNSGIAYNASLTLMLSVSKLDDKESDKIALDRKGDVTKTGVVVTATTKKSRFTIPHIVKFQIPFFKSPNPYVGLEEYITWENSGILRGKLLTKKEYDKLSESDKLACYETTDESGNEYYFDSVHSASGIAGNHISECCSGKRKKCGGFSWRYAEGAIV